MSKANCSPHLCTLVLVTALSLGACQTSGRVIEVPRVVNPCPSEGQADILSEPKIPITESERSQVYTAVAAAIDPLRAQALIKYWEVEVPSWGRQGWSRLDKVRDWCSHRKD